MALSQEFWLQQRRREAKQSAAGVAGNGAAVRTSGTALNGVLPVTTVAAGPVPRRPELQPGLEIEARKDWNSDDESIDEFGRKKTRTRSATCRGMSREAKAPQVRQDTETEMQGGRKGKLSAKQQAALDRLKSRCIKPQAPGNRSPEDKSTENAKVLRLHAGLPPPPAPPPSQAVLPLPPPSVWELPIAAPWLAASGCGGSGQAMWQAVPAGGAAGMPAEARQENAGRGADLDSSLGHRSRSRSSTRRMQPM